MFPLAEVVFASRILGLVAGMQHVEIQTEAHVRSVEVLRDGTPVTTLRGAPWRATVDFGPELQPHELTVIARDAEGREVGRDTQPVNVARPPAEIGVVLDRSETGQVTATIRTGHYAHRDPSRVNVKLDGRLVRKGRATGAIQLGSVDASTIHVLEVEVTFPDGVRARKEVVFGGQAGFAEQMPAELTAVGVRQRANVDKVSKPAPDCFRLGETPLAVSTVERGEAMALFIFNGERGLGRRVGASSKLHDGLFAMPGTSLHVVAPVPRRVERKGGETRMFDSLTVDGTRGTRRLLVTFARTPVGAARIADAAGAAGLIALREGARRVVVLVIGDRASPDQSAHHPVTLRRYLERVGVPLRVWSLVGPLPELNELWGEVTDVSTPPALLAATEELRNELESQRVAWIPVGPVQAVRVQASSDCAFEPLAMMR